MMTGPASLFTIHARGEAVHSGQPCCVCSKSDGELKQIGYDEVLGELWIHTDRGCEEHVCKAVKKAEQKQREHWLGQRI